MVTNVHKIQLFLKDRNKLKHLDSQPLYPHTLRASHTDAAPQLQYTFIEQTVSPGSPVNLKCSAVGSPFPLITWTRDHRPLHTSLRWASKWQLLARGANAFLNASLVHYLAGGEMYLLLFYLILARTGCCTV